jgi:4'-phosphopantetheinyl transferase
LAFSSNKGNIPECLDYTVHSSKTAWLRELALESSPVDDLTRFPLAKTVRLWLLNLQDCSAQAQAFWYLLSEDEQTRALALRSPQQQRFVAVRGSLRWLIGTVLQQDPAGLQFVYGLRGKPALLGNGLEFNLSHSGDLALFALSLTGAVGVDLEQHRPDFDFMAIAERFFAPGEVASLQVQPPLLRAARFWQLWTAKEACLKALGQGLFSTLASIELSIQPTGELALRQLPADAPALALWQLQEFVPAPGYQATLAVIRTDLPCA